MLPLIKPAGAKRSSYARSSGSRHKFRISSKPENSFQQTWSIATIGRSIFREFNRFHSRILSRLTGSARTGGVLSGQAAQDIAVMRKIHLPSSPGYFGSIFRLLLRLQGFHRLPAAQFRHDPVAEDDRIVEKRIGHHLGFSGQLAGPDHPPVASSTSSAQKTTAP